MLAACTWVTAAASGWHLVPQLSRPAAVGLTARVTPISMQNGFMAKVKEINEANKMPAMKKNQPPKVCGRINGMLCG